ncbi:MAG: hypothetical protein WAN50_02030 [Minisyncoccia bacterium]
MTSSGMAAVRHFKRVDPIFHAATKRHHSSLPARLAEKRTKYALFESLVSTVISKQLGMAAADTIFARVKQSCGGKITVDSVLKTRDAKLRLAGLSGAKTKTLKSIATAIQNGELDLIALKKMPEQDAAEKLMRIWGLGPWSVEMFMMFALGREDVFSAGDLGLVRAMETIYGLSKNFPRENILKIAQAWSPYRTYACLLLWRSRDTKAD